MVTTVVYMNVIQVPFFELVLYNSSREAASTKSVFPDKCFQGGHYMIAQ